MATAINHEGGSQSHEAPFPPLERITRPAVDTDSAAYYLGRKAQTLRTWASKENGPLRPIRVHGRLAWPVDQIRKILEVSHA